MARQSRSRPAARPAARPAPAPASQSRGAHTAAAPPATVPHAPPVPAQAHSDTKPPGMLAQMAATAGSVAVGSTIGHGISSMLFGSRSAEAPPPEQLTQAQAAPVQQQNAQGISCEVQAKDFTQCLEKADLQSCTWYLEQLKACHAAAAPY